MNKILRIAADRTRYGGGTVYITRRGDEMRIYRHLSARQLNRLCDVVNGKSGKDNWQLLANFTGWLMYRRIDE